MTLIFAKVALATGCGADGNQGLIKPRHWFEKVMTMPSHDWMERCLGSAWLPEGMLPTLRCRKLIAMRLVLLQLSTEINTMQYCFLCKDLHASASL